MRVILAVGAIFLVSQTALAYNIVNHPTRMGYKRVTCNDGRQTTLYNDHRVYDKAAQYCNESGRRSSTSGAYSGGRRADSQSGSVRCSATRLALESEWKPGVRNGTISVPSTQPVTGSYDRGRYRGDFVCVGGEYKGKREQFQFRCDKDGEWKFVQRFWAREKNCRSDGMISAR